jgi:hypothetical protein
VTRARDAGAAPLPARAAPVRRPAPLAARDGRRVSIRRAAPAAAAGAAVRAALPLAVRAALPLAVRAAPPLAVRAARVVLVALVLAAPVFAAGPARASEVSATQFRTLAGEAVADDAALAQLRAVDTVDGQRVDVDGALRGARGDALDARLRQLADDDEVVPSGRDPRADAREVVSESRFHETEVPGPFTGLIGWLRDRLDDLGLVVPGGPPVLWIVLGAILAVAVWFVARRLLTSRVQASAAQQHALAVARDEDPRALDRRADAAEAAGDLETALRLRFRAGLLRLDEHGAIEFRPSISTGEVRRSLHSEDFDALAATFDDVVYGGRPPASDDLAAARERWPNVIRAAA